MNLSDDAQAIQDWLFPDLGLKAHAWMQRARDGGEMLFVVVDTAGQPPHVRRSVLKIWEDLLYRRQGKMLAEIAEVNDDT